VAIRLRLGRFHLQVRLVLVLLVLFLAILDLMNLYLLGKGKDALARAEEELGRARIQELARSIGEEDLSEAIESGEGGTRLSPTALRRWAFRLGYDRVSLLDRAGREVLGSGPSFGAEGHEYADLSEQGKTALTAGRPALGGMVPDKGGAGARMTGFMPILDSSGRMVGIVSGVRPVPALGRAEQNYRFVLAVQVVGVVLIAGLAAVFAHWVVRPYRRLVAAAGEAGLTSESEERAAEPEELASAFRTVVAKLREQDEALGALGSEPGGLGDLVRFANQAARGMTTGVLVLDRQARVAALNPAAAELLGCDEKAARGDSIDSVAPGVEGLRSRIASCLEDGVGVSREVLGTKQERGTSGHLGVSISPAVGWDGRVAGALVLMTDLTEIRQLQEQARLRDSLAAVGKLSAGIAHELRNALGTILGYARMLEKTEDPRVRGPAKEILKEVDTVRATVDEFLLYARPPEPSRAPVDVEEVIRACAEAADPALEVEVEGEFGEVTGDEALLKRAFDNLLRNSAEATEPGRRVHVRVRGRPAAGGRVLQIDMDDDGPGIPAELREQVFAPFFTTRDRGTGLGLALVQRTIVELGGTIEAGQGTRGGAQFRIRLPLAVGEQATGV
jgi:PAS domain S-box-containing protein